MEGHSPRQSINGTSTTSSTGGTGQQSFESWLSDYWYILLIVLAVLVVLCVLVCACILRTKPRYSTPPGLMTAPPTANNNNESLRGSNNTNNVSSIRSSMPTISGGSTPIPSPNSSQQSVRGFNGVGGANGRIVRASPRLSSTSSDTLRPGANSVSSNSSTSLLRGGASPNRSSPNERSSRRPRGPMVRVTSLPDVQGGMRPAGSMVSVESSGSGRTGVSYRVHPSIDSEAVVEVGVTVLTPGDPERASRIATAAAIAESARKLAQEAASFIDNEAERDHYRMGSSYYSRPGSGRSARYPVSYHSPYRGTAEERGRPLQYERYNYPAPQGIELYEYHYPDSDQYQSDSYHRTNIDSYHDPYYSDTDPAYFNNRGGAHYYSYRHGNAGTRRSSDTRVQYNETVRANSEEDEPTGGSNGENGLEGPAGGGGGRELVDDEETTSSMESEASGEDSIRPPPPPLSSSAPAAKHLKNRHLKTYNTTPAINPGLRPEPPSHYFYRQNSYPKIRGVERYGHYHHGPGPVGSVTPRDRRHSITYKQSTHLPHPIDDHITVDV
ncbi:PREDICTED: uncharacterized protein LOC100631703 [Amphimedon queenslandica]|uniref:Uncharacterized protein n=1 Tax=Amphimedon queenslandica TaxID=400682 RepID=A0A1X7UDP1_AMPQE|nr:PREDICTED: uncharacterized protein LOC100631703 [Amphimedon queenslandica]|eukprot:XP_003388322.1 PREDICTED: uncharacterized protein LOC100631703 [Amphimedon queenslandica]